VTATGAVTSRPPAHTELERWYRRLLRAYPRSYRRTHGDEILATLMDAAEPARRRPTRTDVVDLARGALRQRFRLPLGVAPIVAAVLTALILGAVGAACGSWLAWQTAAELPSDAAATGIAATVLGGPQSPAGLDRAQGPRELWPAVTVNYEPHLSGWTLAEAQARLRAAGWTPGRVQRSTAGVYAGEESLDNFYQVFEATRDGYVLIGYALTITAPQAAGVDLRVSVRPAEPSWSPVAVALGWLAGAVAGWLLTGWASYRLRRRTLARRATVLMLGLTAVGLAAHPAIGLYVTLRQIAFGDADIYGVAPPYRWVVTTLPAGLIAGTLLAGVGILVLATTGRQRTARAAQTG
jgi:hypothetical protein